jgi:hypothetical protein
MQIRVSSMWINTMHSAEVGDEHLKVTSRAQAAAAVSSTKRMAQMDCQRYFVDEVLLLCRRPDPHSAHPELS